MTAVALFPPTSRRVTARFTKNLEPSDPDEVIAEFGLRGQTPTRLVYGVDDELVHEDDLGAFTVEVDCTAAGRWSCKITGRWSDGTYGDVYKALEESWIIERSQFAGTLGG